MFNLRDIVYTESVEEIQRSWQNTVVPGVVYLFLVLFVCCHVLSDHVIKRPVSHEYPQAIAFYSETR